jgi:rhomboid family protein
MIPLGDASRRPVHFPAITAALIAVNVAAFGLELVHGEAFVVKWAPTPAELTAGHRLVTILTAMFLHGGVLHILGNMVFFWAFAPSIEDAVGPLRFLAFYLLGGLLAFAGQIALDPTSPVPTLGASGAIAAVMGGFLVTYPYDRINTLVPIGLFFTMVEVRRGC